MTRNLDRRVELLFPLKDDRLRDRVRDIFQTMWQDNVKTRVLQPDGTFVKKDRRGVMTYDAQEMFIAESLAAQQKRQDQVAATEVTRRFEPLNNPFVNEESRGDI